MHWYRALGSVLLAKQIHAQYASSSQNVTFNSSYALAQSQIDAANLTEELTKAIGLALDYERTNWAGSSVLEDDFYHPPDTSDAAPGALLKVEQVTNSTLYTIPPGTALSRIVYATETSNGTMVPASAFILWPYSPRNLSDGFPIIAWARGYTGFTSECAPSRNRNLWTEYTAPFILALAGYVVVAPDFAGIGVSTTADGRIIYAESFVATAHGNDLVYAVEAAQSAFSSLSSKFVVLGHSEGAIAAWAVARLQRERQNPGYLGTVVASPFWPPFLRLESEEPEWLAVWTSPAMLHGMRSIHPDFNISNFFTETGIAFYNLIVELGGCISVHANLFLFQQPDVLQPGWTEVDTYQEYAGLTRNAGLEIAGPMLVLQAAGDSTANATIAAQQVNETCHAFPDSSIEYVEYNLTGHSDALFAGQRVWLDWIRERFEKPEGASSTGCSWTFLQPSTEFAAEAYQQGGPRYFLQCALAPYLTV